MHKCTTNQGDWRSNWNLEMLVFQKRGKPEYPEKNPSEQQREPTTNSTHMICGLSLLLVLVLDTGTRSWTRATLMGGECSHRCAIPVFKHSLIIVYSSTFQSLPRQMLELKATFPEQMDQKEAVCHQWLALQAQAKNKTNWNIRKFLGLLHIMDHHVVLA